MLRSILLWFLGDSVVRSEELPAIYKKMAEMLTQPKECTPQVKQYIKEFSSELYRLQNSTALGEQTLRGDFKTLSEGVTASNKETNERLLDLEDALGSASYSEALPFIDKIKQRKEARQSEEGNNGG